MFLQWFQKQTTSEQSMHAGQQYFVGGGSQQKGTKRLLGTSQAKYLFFIMVSICLNPHCHLCPLVQQLTTQCKLFPFFKKSIFAT